MQIYGMKYTKELLGPAVASSFSVAEVIRKIGAKCSGGSHHKCISRAIDRLGLDRSHFQLFPTPHSFTTRRDWAYYLVKRKTSLESKLLRRSMLESGIEYRCAGENCPNPDPIWAGKPLKLQADHKSGDNTDCRPTNLRFLCPNCHTQTPTHSRMKSIKTCPCGQRSRNGRCKTCHNSNRPSRMPSKDVLESMIWQMPTTHIAKMFEVSDKAVTKWCKKYNLEKPGQGYWKKHARQ